MKPSLKANLPQTNSSENTSPSYSRSKPVVTPQSEDLLKVQAHKIGCRSPMCPLCQARSLKEYSERMRGWEWFNVRHLMLTVDGGAFESCEQAYFEITRLQSVNRTVSWLRTHGVIIRDWIGVLEFDYEGDGRPHWHILLWTSDGKPLVKTFGIHTLLNVWKHGWVKEDYIHNSEHWKNMTGYFSRTGYFEGRGGKFPIPDWVLDSPRVIRRFFGQVTKKDGVEKKADGAEKYGHRDRSERRTYRAILSECGSSTRVRIQAFPTKDLPGWRIEENLPTLLMNVRTQDFVYEPGEGYTAFFDRDELMAWLLHESHLSRLISRIFPDGVVPVESGPEGSESDRPPGDPGEFDSELGPA